ncbi:MAG: DUF4097 family beta strand repeat-containing protein [Bacteroidota bacterium]|nr:DUF4097 domain-containing protein [Ignavibacteria bacterium]MCU7522427.1 DUF4097 domain-containing protein [Ignavibacteria bacterium]
MKKLIMIAVILALGFSVSFAIDGSSLTRGISFMFPFGYTAPAKNSIEKKNDDERVVEKEFKASKGKTLTINLKTGGGIVVKGWDKDLVNIKATIGGRDAKDLKFDFNEVEQGVEINSKYTGDKEGWSSDCDLVIMVPDKFNLSLYSMGGAVSLSNIEGRMTGKTMGGALTLDHLKGYLELKTMGGAVTLTSSNVDGRVETMGGPVMMEDVTGGVKGHTMSGKVDFSNVNNKNAEDIKDEVKITSMGGGINVNAAPLGADVSTMGGEIKINSAKKYVKAKTMGGNITILDVDGSVNAHTMGGDVEVNMTGTGDDRDVKLTSMSGDVTLEIPADFSMNVKVKLAYTEGREGKYKIESDFGLSQDESKEWDGDEGTPRKYITGTGSFNGGKNSVVIETINGNVLIKKH